MLIDSTLFWYAHLVQKKIIWCGGRIGLCEACQKCPEGQEVVDVLNIGHYSLGPKNLYPEPWRACEWIEEGHVIKLKSGEDIKTGPIQRPDIFTKCIKEVPQVDGSE